MDTRLDTSKHEEQDKQCCIQGSHSATCPSCLAENFKAQIERLILEAAEKLFPSSLTGKLHGDHRIAAPDATTSLVVDHDVALDCGYHLIDRSGDILMRHSDAEGQLSFLKLEVDDLPASTQCDAGSQGSHQGRGHGAKRRRISNVTEHNLDEAHSLNGILKKILSQLMIIQSTIDSGDNLRPKTIQMADDDLFMGNSDPTNYSPPTNYGYTPEARPHQESSHEQDSITSESEFWGLMAKTGPWLDKFENEGMINWLIKTIEHQRYGRCCHLQNDATEDDGHLDNILKHMRIFLERRICVLRPPVESEPGNNVNVTRALERGTPPIAPSLPPNNRVSVESVASEGLVSSREYHQNDTATLESPSKKRKTRHASSDHSRDSSREEDLQTLASDDWENIRERASTFQRGRTTPTPLRRPSTTLNQPMSSPLRNRPLPLGTTSVLGHREEQADTGMVPLPYRVYMCRGEPHLLMPVSRFKETNTLGGRDHVALANTSSSTTVYINSNLRQ
ncbi:hypothetical protein B0T21DRAFT_344096 [Apiosordaria backusii]|uniref:Uncharacterized protein n=1 Tax=Apiosordaria backusii TaxID=314023 RepID=A0AA40EZI9_9PEZI|nr:hypothetical protein B0T21DRAFT_344096 [Apiosordaria backusii]